MKNTDNVKSLRIRGGEKLMDALKKDGWRFDKILVNHKTQWLATSPAGQEEANSSLKKLLLNCSWHPMYN